MIWKKKSKTLNTLAYFLNNVMVFFGEYKKYRKKKPKSWKDKKWRIIPLSKYAVCDIKNSDFIKEQEARVL